MKSSVVLFGCFLGWVSATVAWADAPSIITQPQDQTNVQGGTFTFCVEATGTPPLTYQWREYISPLVFTDIPGATNQCLVLTNVQMTRDMHRFRVVVTNFEGRVLSRLAKLKVGLYINSGPEDSVADLGGNVTFSVMVGEGAVSYQWLKDGAIVEGETSPSLSLSSLGLGERGAYSVAVSNNLGTVTSPSATLTLIEKVTTGAVVENLSRCTGAAWGDYDNDGWVDLFVANGWPNILPNFLYHNNGDGTFTRMSETDVGSIVTDYAVFGSPTWGDIDNDGFLDILVSNWQGETGKGNFLYRNDGDGTFTRLTGPDPIVDDRQYSFFVAWGDYNNDGHLDLFASSARNGRYVNNFQDVNSLYHNNGDGSFTRETEAGIGTEFTDSEAPAWADYDNDGDLDLVVANGESPIFVFQNQGNGTFTRIMQGALAGAREGSFVHLTWGDYDNDGWLDLVITDSLQGGITYLYHNNGGGDFTAHPLSSRANSAAWGDIDNDGDLDVFLGVYNANNMLYINDGDGLFHPETHPVLVNESVVSEAPIAWADYDNNGFLDLIVCNLMPTPNFLFRNHGNQNHWLMLNLVGTVANRSAIGAKVRVKADIRGQATWQMREISGGGWGQNDLRAHFGLGEATLAETIRIEWPSGTVQELQDVAANQILTVIEPPRLATDAPGSIQLRGGKGMVYSLQSSPAMEPETWSDLVTMTNTTGTASYLDPDAGVLDQRFYRAVQDE